MKVVPSLLVFLAIASLGVAAQTPSSQPRLPAPPSETEQDEVVRVNTTLVSVPVSVMDRNGKYILDLRVEDFEVYENGTKQEITYFDQTGNPFTIVLMLDISDSMGSWIGHLQTAALAFLDQLSQKDRVMVIAVDSQIRVLCEPTTNHDVARDAIRRTNLGAGTRVYDALDFVLHQRIKQLRGRKAIILFSDGVDTGSSSASLKENLRDAEESDVLIYPVHYNSSTDPNFQLRAAVSGPSGSPLVLPRGSVVSNTDKNRGEYYLRMLSRKTGARIYHVDDGQRLTNAFLQIAGELRQQYTLSYYPKTPGQPGERRQIKVRVKKPQLAVRARESYIFKGSAGDQSPRKR